MTTATLSHSEKADCLRLIRSENVGPLTFFALLEHYGSASDALDAIPELAARGGRRAIRIAPDEAIENELAAMDVAGARIIAWCEPDYPAPLAAIPDPPPLISVLGDRQHLAQESIAIVGARNASAAGRRFARALARDLGEAGLVIASGLARGIDTAAHEGALETGTVAVLAGGIDVAYPPENADLLARIAASGAVISEQPPGTRPTARHFPPRNRLISGISRGVLVVEAALRSGSRITARMALEQGREVFAVPGSPLDPRCRGTNDLIRQGAILTEGADDILREISSSMRLPARAENVRISGDRPARRADATETDSARAQILDLLSATPIPIDELARECQMSAASVMAAVLELELAGKIERNAGNRVSRLP